MVLDLQLYNLRDLTLEEYLDSSDATNYQDERVEKYFNDRGIKYYSEKVEAGDWYNQTYYSQDFVDNVLKTAYEFSNKHPNAVYGISAWDFDMNAMKYNNYIDIDTKEEMNENLRGSGNAEDVGGHAMIITG